MTRIELNFVEKDMVESASLVCQFGGGSPSRVCLFWHSMGHWGT